MSLTGNNVFNFSILRLSKWLGNVTLRLGDDTIHNDESYECQQNDDESFESTKLLILNSAIVIYWLNTRLLNI